jgi:hypothetical protein
VPGFQPERDGETSVVYPEILNEEKDASVFFGL